LHLKSSQWKNNMAPRQLPSNHHRQQHLPKAYEVITIIAFLFLLTILGFILIVGFNTSNRVSPAYGYAMQTKAALETNPTPTPFQPEVVGYEPEAREPEVSVPDGETPQNPDATPVPTLPPLQKPEGQVNILLLGSDVREGDYGFRTDSIIWVSLNPKDGFVSAVSFPRDLFVEIPGRGENRINVAFGVGGFDLLADTMQVNFGVRPDHYVLIDMYGFATLINNLGGINVETEKNLSDSCATWVNPSGWCSVGPGLVLMNGDTALWYVRSRYSTNDIERARRSQEVVEAIFKRLMSLDAVLRAPDLYDAYTSFVQTDVDLATVVSLLPLAKNIYEDSDIRNYVIGFDQAYSWITPAGAQVLVPDKALIREVMIEALQIKLNGN
jgi:polyisoprenyl-teichoic acid--peptidoglycan teichoic acid transferase